VDPAIHNSNTLQIRGRPLALSSGATGYKLDGALAAVRRFVEERGVLPTSASWTAAGMRPSEKTIRRRFGSFKAALQFASIDTVEVHLTATPAPAHRRRRPPGARR
jgi:hypothetical protein